MDIIWEIEYTDEFEEWWDQLTAEEQISVESCIALLERYGPALTRPYSDNIHHSRHTNMKELRIQHLGSPYRVLYAFDPRRMAILLIGGNKKGIDRWYDMFIPVADALYDEHLKEIDEKE